MRGALLVLLLVGCVANDGAGGDEPESPPAQPPDLVFELGDAPPEHELPPGCDHAVSLHGMTAYEVPPAVGPINVGREGTNICLTLDTRDNIWLAHFAATTQYETGGSSSFELALADRDGVMIRAGWDVTFGGSPPQSFANVEHGIAAGQVVEAVLDVRAKTGVATSIVQLHLFEPLE